MIQKGKHYLLRKKPQNDINQYYCSEITSTCYNFQGLFVLKSEFNDKFDIIEEVSKHKPGLGEGNTDNRQLLQG
jgi:hypothetical protein